MTYNARFYYHFGNIYKIVYFLTMFMDKIAKKQKKASLLKQALRTFGLMSKQSTGLFFARCGAPSCSNPCPSGDKKDPQPKLEVLLVGVTGFEPTASSSRTRRATNCAMPRKYRNPMGCGLVGDERIELPQVESESTALPLCKSPLFGFALSTEALLTRNIIQPPPPFVNHFFDFSVHVFSAFSTTAFSRLFSSPALDTRPLWEYSYSIIHLPPLRENGRNEGCSI